MTFRNFFTPTLLENTLYTTPTERAALVSDKSKISDIFIYNFLGTLGLLNATPIKAHGLLINHFKQDKKVRITEIGDDNHDISLSVKLADEIGYFRTPTTVNEITRFLFKLKSGQITEIDNAQIVKWLDGMTADFVQNISDPRNKALLIDYKNSHKSIGSSTPFDISRLSMNFKKRANKTDLSGDFKIFAKPYILTERPYVAPGTSPAVVPTALASLSQVSPQNSTSGIARSTFDGTPDPVVVPPRYTITSRDISYNLNTNDTLNKFQTQISEIKYKIYSNVSHRSSFSGDYNDLDITYIKTNLKSDVDDLMNTFLFQDSIQARKDISFILKTSMAGMDGSVSYIIHYANNTTPFQIDTINFKATYSFRYRSSLNNFILIDNELKNSIRSAYTSELFYNDFKSSLYSEFLDSDDFNLDIIGLNNPNIPIPELISKFSDIYFKFKESTRTSSHRSEVEIQMLKEIETNFSKYVTMKVVLMNTFISTNKNIVDIILNAYPEDEAKSFVVNELANVNYDKESIISGLKILYGFTARELIELNKDQADVVVFHTINVSKSLQELNNADILPIFKKNRTLFDKISLLSDDVDKARFIELYKEHLKLADKSEVESVFYINVLRKAEIVDTKDTIDFLRICKDKGIENPFPPDDGSKRNGNRDTVSSILSSLISDTMGTDVEDYISDITESMPPVVINAMRANMVGLDKLKTTIEEGEIKPFAVLDKARVKQILLYNNLSFSKLLKGNMPRKSKKEKWVDYLKKAAVIVKDLDLLEKPKVTLDVNLDMKSLNKTLVDAYHAGKHGNIYPKILKIFDCNMTFPEFEDFKKTNPGGESITPAFHGTGGVAAAMILRYGFTIIKATDGSVTGRMLGNGVYFSNKIDKALQYVSNKGFGRQHGSKGYILVLDTNLGTKYIDYQSAGTNGSSGTVSPEWAVFNPKAQIKITKIYEVELVSKQDYDTYLNESTKFQGFKSFLKESPELQQSYTTFTFYDGQIPILVDTPNESNVMNFVDFEVALENGSITPDMLEYTANGPTIRFKTETDTHYDVRFASAMPNHIYSVYTNLITNKM